MNYRILFIALALSLLACKSKNPYDASGSFETDEVIVSAEQTGTILSLKIQEGDSLQAGQSVGAIDVSALEMQKEQKEASVKAIGEKTVDARPRLELVRKQLAVQQSQMEQQLHERDRIANLVKADAATKKQLDDMNATIDQLQKSMDVTKQQIADYASSIRTGNRSILSEKEPALKNVALVEHQIKKGHIINPIRGRVLTQYAFEGEYAVMGKPLYKIGDVSVLTLRAYITGSQLPQVKLNQHVQVLVDNGPKDYTSYDGVITWISDKAEFTPKTIQTKDERANLVYAMKIKVKNNGYLKIGMYGEVKF